MTTIGLLRPTLLPGLTRIRRGPRTIQFGTDAWGAVLVELPDERAAAVLDLLDGAHTERQVLATALRRGVRPSDTRELLATLHASGLVVPAHTLATTAPHLRAEAAALALRQAAQHLSGQWARRGPLPDRRDDRPGSPSVTRPAPHGSAAVGRGSGLVGSAGENTLGGRGPGQGVAAWEGESGSHPPTSPLTPAETLRRRAAARVLVSGRGRLAAPIALTLARSGIGQVRPDLPGTLDPAEAAAAGLDPAAVGKPRSQAVAAAIAAAGARPGTTKPQVVVRVGADQPAQLAAAAARRRGQAMLSVEVRDGIPEIGPFVPPDGSPCLACRDLHRTDRDPAWPDIAAGLATSRSEEEACDLVTIMAAAAFAAGQVLVWTDGGDPVTTATAVSLVTLADLRWRRWPAHPRCSCVRSEF
ncbi:hypothetical protein O7635_13855 [Asanoa sp. WMMD1127]|uniref:hypothetical protein n=1 Tax=Asanoa sp. WMMD1127 TaxID=3016107 RepID=UPI00241618BD|nr:hypothetical protein [Asanoa sp. WMMD1127]MDG4822935.1 hypothetical protein [Asanoa sp. WMMD1127]